MNKILKNTIGIILFLIIILLGASIITDFLVLIFKDNLNKTFFFVIQVILIYIMIQLLSKTPPVKNLLENIFGKSFNKKPKSKKKK